MEFAEPAQVANDEVSVEANSEITHGRERHNAMNMVELHAIYNRHFTKSDARRTTEMIDEGSIVYVEGIQFSPDDYDKDDIFLRAEKLGVYKRNHGKNGEYQKAKKFLIKGFKSYIADLATDASKEDGDDYDARLFLELLKKDCQIISADYIYRNSSESYELMRETAKQISNTHYSSAYKLFDSLDAHSELSQHITTLEGIMVDKRTLHERRESDATSVIVKDMESIIANARWSRDAPRSDSGKMKGYICYGAAHHYSLTNKLRNAGIEAVTHNLFPLHENVYLDETIESFQANYLRRLSNLAFDAISRTMIGDDADSRTYESTVDYMYRSLEEVNTDREKALDFVTKCLMIRRRSAYDHTGSNSDYINLLRDYGRDTDIEE